MATLGSAFCAVGQPVASQAAELIRVNGMPLFLNGMNLAWLSFASDLEYFNEARFKKAVSQVAAAGGNTIRWWLHTNGSVTPQFDSATGLVSGNSAQSLANLRKALDDAAAQGVGLILCLWSFDMLQTKENGVNTTRNLSILRTDQGLQAFIDNSLVPMVRAVKGHPGIIAWEVFNEPEGMCGGFGWTPVRIQIRDVQRVVNRVAGAIHREAPGSLVTNGTWSFRALSDVDGFTNYYRDDRLIAAGGDADGTLDFYSVHYYPQHQDDSVSPFSNPKSYWGLDKPVVVGEFPAAGIVDLGTGFMASQRLSPVQAFTSAYDGGYAGALGWTWTAHDGLGGLPEAAPGISALAAEHPDFIRVKAAQP